MESLGFSLKAESQVLDLFKPYHATFERETERKKKKKAKV